tara:strand:+ start:443 stop:739 length:297 start_codon:yes stop_codon:yes gene_type:complete
MWQEVDGQWIAYADDGKGYHDGDGKYTVNVPVADFGEKLLLGGEARFTDVTGGRSEIFKLPLEIQSSDSFIQFNIRIEPLASQGRYLVASGLQVRVCA